MSREFMTRHERAIYNKMVEDKEQEFLEDGLSGEDALEKAQEYADMSYDDHADQMYESSKDERMERDMESGS